MLIVMPDNGYFLGSRKVISSFLLLVLLFLQSKGHFVVEYLFLVALIVGHLQISQSLIAVNVFVLLVDHFADNLVDFLEFFLLPRFLVAKSAEISSFLVENIEVRMRGSCFIFWEAFIAVKMIKGSIYPDNGHSVIPSIRI